MDKATRKITILNSSITGEKKNIIYKKINILLDVHEIPLTALLYNPYNGRIKSSVLSHESSFQKKIDPENEKDRLIIEQYLYDSSNRNDKTMESLVEKGQQEVGIVTNDGVIIDGNRRALLLNMINKKNNTQILFKAIVLPDELQGNKKDITLLETSYQMGVDSKIDYNPIEKYLRCKELNEEHKLSIRDISDIMAEKETKIQEWLNILRLMDEYLTRLKTPEVYTRLEKREGHFVDLNNYLKAYLLKINHAVKWEYSVGDVHRMKFAYFDYIRLPIPVQRARVIGKAASSNSFFCHKEIWDNFITEHEKIINTYSEPVLSVIKEAEPDKSNEDITRYLDEKWKESLEEKLDENFSLSESKLKDLVELHTPIKILRRVVNSLGQIDNDQLIQSSKPEAEKLLGIIHSKSFEMLNLFSK